MKLFFFALFLSAGAFAADTMEAKLDALNIPDNQISPVISQDKVFVLNTRYSSLTNRHEATLAGANNFNNESHLTTQNASLAYRYHINPKWSLGLRHSEYYNKLTPAGQKLLKDEKIAPDSDFSKNSNEVFTNFNLFYGKMRMTQKTVMYFDQYLGLGAGKINLARGSENMVTADIGVAFWMGSNMSSRFGMRNEFYKQTTLSGQKNVHNVNGYLEIGYLFGEGSSI